jgi:hypothetical protein
MTSTDDLIRSLASTAGTGSSNSLRAAFAATVAASVACALLLVFSVVGIRHDFAEMAVRIPFAFKLAYTAALVAGASILVFNAATPGASTTASYALAPAVALLALGVLLDPTGFPITGETSTAVVVCVGRILLLSLPAMILVFVFMRKAAPTRPVFAGAAIGLLSASMGALVHTLDCRNDGVAFVAIWYTVACVLMAAVGALAGKRILRW